MATNLQIYALRTNADLLKRIEVGIARYAMYIRGLGAGASIAQRDWAKRVFELGKSQEITQAAAWEIVNNPIVRDAADVSGLSDEGAGSLQVAIESCCLNY